MASRRRADHKWVSTLNQPQPIREPMPETLTKFLQAFIPLFVAIDPVGLAAVFLGLGQGVAPAVRHRIAWQATVTGGAVALGFL